MPNFSSSRKGNFSPGRSPVKKKQMSGNMNLIEKIHNDKQRELIEIQRIKELHQAELDQLKTELWNLRSGLPEMQLELEKLDTQYKGLERAHKSKESELSGLGFKLEHDLKDLIDEFQLFKQNTELEFNLKIDEISENYEARTQNIMIQKQETFNKRKIELTNQLNDTTNSYGKLDQELKTSIDNMKNEFESNTEDYKTKIQDEKASLFKEKHLIENEILNIEKQIKTLQQDLIERRATHTTLVESLENAKAKSSIYEKSTFEIHSEITILKKQITKKELELERLGEESEHYIAASLGLKEKLLNEETTRRKLHNQLQELKGNIRVFCRLRPNDSEESFKTETSNFSDCHDGKEYITITEPQNPNQNKHTFNNKITTKTYKFGFDKVFSQNSTNSEIFDEISQLVQSALDGYNVCIFTYGQTGSGKTHTMSNPNDGLIPRSVSQIFSTAKKLKESNWEFEIYGQFLEIYNENINDLTNSSYLKNLDMVKHEIKHDEATQTTTITDLTTIKLENAEQVNDILKTANRNRVTASTNSNMRSSRSHSIFIIHLKGVNYKTCETVNGKLNLIDLAGSERISQSLVTGDRLKETQSINRSLSSLGDVILSLCNQNPHIPYRNSKLTYLLQYSLGGNSKTLMFVNISGNIKHFNETLNSLRFATKVNRTHIGQPQKKN